MIPEVVTSNKPSCCDSLLTVQDLRGAEIKETKAGLALGLPVAWMARLRKGIWKPFFPLAPVDVTSSGYMS